MIAPLQIDIDAATELVTKRGGGTIRIDPEGGVCVFNYPGGAIKKLRFNTRWRNGIETAVEHAEHETVAPENFRASPSKDASDLPRPSPKAANDNREQKWPGIVSSGDLVRGFVPPDYHLEGIAQAGFLYSTTAMTGTGKTAVLLLLAAHTALGKPISDREVRKGRVVYFAGENPDDVTMRWIAMAHHMRFDPDAMDVHFIKGTFSISKMFARIKQEVTKLGGAELVVVDTSAAYFQGQEENSNTELGRHARDLRTLTTLPGSPCVLVACHPVKAADASNLLPRGGGAFIAELDGNLVLTKGDAGSIRLHWQGKHRGPDFEPLHFDLKTVTAPALIDSKGRDVPTVMASAVSTGETVKRGIDARKDEDEVLLLIETDGDKSLQTMAEILGWKEGDGSPHKRRVQTATDKLKRLKLVTHTGRKWGLTSIGQTAAVDARAERFKAEQAATAASNLVAKSGRSEPYRAPYDDHDE
ncbi:AAA family ATPase [Mesorhizobium ventifaucium]|uniref:DNA primase n=1 Tax=Mesorhizobium ventifaucium TaxID=666020 RepID=A0ABN8KE98_9HYPH|nr:AAA family ATPase [Mesorhizobium ventifaucium]CAH2408001.1 DNA primase [Mesorhizobium ventifaucium]